MKDNAAALKMLAGIPRLRLAGLETPIEECVRLRAALSSAARIFIKRDDQTGYLCGGNKLRKLEYILADALEQKATAVITVGSVQSNHARITAMAARRLGLRCLLVLNGEEPEEPRSNYLLSTLLGAEVHFVESRPDRDSRMEELACQLEKNGERVYRIPLGASNALGSIGFVAAFAEMIAQGRAMGLRFKALVISSSSGGTQAGLEAGKRLFRDEGLDILGVSPDDPAASIKDNIQAALQPMLDRFEVKSEADRDGIFVDDRYVGQGYGIPTPYSTRAAEVFARTEGLLLDPVYTAKAAAALLHYCQSGRFRPGDNVLFWHTGGLAALFK